MQDREQVDQYGPFYRMYSLVNSYSDPGFLPRLAAYRTLVDQLLDESRDGAVLVHCTGGRDRTGIGIAILLRAVGVAEEAIEADYLASNRLLQPERDDPDSTLFRRFTFSNVFVQPTGNLSYAKAAAELGETPEHLYDAVKLRAEYLRDLWATIDLTYGSFDAFLTAELDLTPERIDRLKDVLTSSR